MNKKRKRWILCFVILLLASFNRIIYVWGEGGHSNGGASGGGDHSTTAACHSYYNGYSYSGIRISVVDKNGRRIAGTKSIDVFPSVQNLKQSSSLGAGTYVLAAPHGAYERYPRYDYLDGIDTNVYRGRINVPVITAALSTEMYNASDVFAGITGLSAYSHTAVQDADSRYNPSLQSQDITRIYEHIQNTDSTTGYPFLTNLLKNYLNFKGPNELSATEIEETYIMFETILVEHVCDSTKGVNGTIYGTMTEIATMFSTWHEASETGDWSLSNYLMGGRSTLRMNASCGFSKCAPIGITPTSIEMTTTSMRRTDAGDYMRNPSSGYGAAIIWLGSVIRESDCNTVVGKINAKYYGTSDYDSLISKVRTGTLDMATAQTYDLKDDTTGEYLTITSPQDYDLLEKSNYTGSRNPTPNYASCADLPAVTIPTVCTSSADPELNIGPCDGNNYVKDNQDKQNWLVCETAYIKDGTSYSSDNTGHKSTETTKRSTADYYSDDPDTEDAVYLLINTVGNREYCAVFCKEEADTQFPLDVANVKASMTFVWSTADEQMARANGLFGSITIDKHCENQDGGYKYNDWLTDYKRNETRKIENFLQWKVNAISNSKLVQVGTPAITPRCPLGTYLYTLERPIGTATHSGDTWLGTTITKETECSNPGASKNGSTCRIETCASTLEIAMDNAKADELTYSTKYGYKHANELPYLDKIDQCVFNLEYVYDTAVEFFFEKLANKEYGPLSQDDFKVWPKTLDRTEITLNNNSNVKIDGCVPETVYRYECTALSEFSTISCTNKAETVTNCTPQTKVFWDVHALWEYNYPAPEFTWWSLKIGDRLMNTKSKTTEFGNSLDEYFYSIGYGLPTAFSLPDGNYPLKVFVGKIGDDAQIRIPDQTKRPNTAPLHTIPKEHFRPLFTDQVNSRYGFYYDQCVYSVRNELFGYDCEYNPTHDLTSESPEHCDPTKNDDPDGHLQTIDVVYRLVSLVSTSMDNDEALQKAFPGRDGQGRDPGYNWRLLTDDEIKDVLDDNVYNESPMFEIMLDVNAIQYIRKDNNSYRGTTNLYSSFYDESNVLKVHCATNGNQKYCASDFLTELHTTSDLNYPLDGTCFVGSNAIDRAQQILSNGGACNGTYSYRYDWLRGETR